MNIKVKFFFFENSKKIGGVGSGGRFGDGVSAWM